MPAKSADIGYFEKSVLKVKVGTRLSGYTIKELIAQRGHSYYDRGCIGVEITDELLSKSSEDRARFLVQYALENPDKPLGPLAERLFPQTAAAARQGSEPLALPTKAPALWREARGRGESPPDFIRRTYAPWIADGMPRALLRQLDEPLYFALSHWLRTNPMPEDVKLLTAKERNDRWVEQVLNDPDGANHLAPEDAARFSAALRTRLESGQVTKTRRG